MKAIYLNELNKLTQMALRTALQSQTLITLKCIPSEMLLGTKSICLKKMQVVPVFLQYLSLMQLCLIPGPVFSSPHCASIGKY